MSDAKLYALIMAGGKGQRLWPLSREHRPKQSLTLHGTRSLFQMAVDRLRPLIPATHILVVTIAEYVELLHAQTPDLPRENFIIEPAQRGTGPCIGLAAQEIVRRDPEAVMAVLTADHFIQDVERFRAVLLAAAEVAQGGDLVTLGISPSFPATGYGYIERAEARPPVAGFAVYQVARFVEKPRAETAAEMVLSGRFSWNSGMFIWRAARILEEFAAHMPAFYARLQEIAAVRDDLAQVAALWATIQTQAIDYGVMEHAARVVVFPVDLGWSDVGSWQTLLEVLPGDDADGNVIYGTHRGLDTKHTLVHSTSGRLVTTIGLTDMIIVDTPDVLLVCPADRAQDVRRVVESLRLEERRAQL